MRFVYLACFVSVALGAFLWFRTGSVDDAAGPQRAATAQHGRFTPTDPAVRKAGAATTIRSTNLTSTAPAPPSNRQSSTAGPAPPAVATPKSPPAATAAAPANPDVKPAAELFSGFVEDDPRTVFLPSSVHYHAAVQSESVDPAWGPAAAEALRNFVATRYGNRFELPLVDCRQDLCELRVAGQVGGDQLADMQDFQQLVQDMKRESWWTALEFDQQTGMIGTAPDGRALLLYFFSRK
jgi:hypothetical protein